jgi:hypothetical protein
VVVSDRVAPFDAGGAGVFNISSVESEPLFR